jgi:hypothetical protein
MQPFRMSACRTCVPHLPVISTAPAMPGVLSSFSLRRLKVASLSHCGRSLQPTRSSLRRFSFQGRESSSARVAF